MLLERTLTQLDVGALSPEEATELGHLGYLQWLGGLPEQVNYRLAVLHALTVAAPFMATSPAVSVFCDLLIASTRMPPEPLHLRLPSRQRRGGATARRRAF